MADNFNPMHYLSLTALEALETSDDPVEEVRVLNQAAFDQGAASAMFPGDPATVLHNMMMDQRMEEHLQGQTVNGHPFPDRARMDKVETMDDLRTLLSI